VLPMLDPIVNGKLDAQLDERLTTKRPATVAVQREIADRAIARLEPIAAEHRRREAADAARLPDLLAFDASAEGERLRRYQVTCSRNLFRSLEMFLKIRKSGVAAASDRDESTATVQAESVGSRADAVIPPADREDSQNEPIDPPLEVVRRAEMTGPAEAGTSINDPADSPLESGPGGGSASASTDLPLQELAIARPASPPDATETPRAAEPADLHRPSLRASIVPLTLALALALLAGLVAQGREESQNEPRSVPSASHSSRNEASAAPAPGAGIAQVEVVGDRPGSRIGDRSQETRVRPGSDDPCPRRRLPPPNSFVKIKRNAGPASWSLVLGRVAPRMSLLSANGASLIFGPSSRAGIEPRTTDDR
jgi:hypothetical protein